MTVTTPTFLLAPAPNLTFAAAPSGTNYVSDRNGLIVVTNGSTADIQALQSEGCTVLAPSMQYANLNYTTAAACATTAALPANTYANGAAGVGATLTGNANGAFPSIDGVAAALNARYWVKNEATPANNGLYALTQMGDASHPWILARASDANTAALIGNIAAFVSGGSANTGSTWAIPLSSGQITLGSTALVPVLVDGPQGVAAETARAQAAEGVLAAGVANSAGTLVALVALENDMIFPDENVYAGGEFDGVGSPLIGIVQGGGVKGYLNSQQNPPQMDPVFPDDVSAIEGDVGVADMNGNILFPVPNSLITSVATTAANSAVTAALAPYPNDDLAWPDDVSQFQGDLGFADTNGNILNAVPPATITSAAIVAANSALAIAEATNIPTDDAAWPDDVTAIPGDIGFADLNSRLLNYQLAPNAYSVWNTYADPTSNSYVTAQNPAQAAFPIACARGANASTPNPSIPNCDSRPDSSGLLRWTDNGTADGLATRSGAYFTPAVEFREFNFNGAASVLALSSITKIVFIPMIGQSLSNGTTASPLTTTNIFSRAFMFNGGPMPYQEFVSNYAAPGALCQDSQLLSLIPLVEIEKAGGINGETYGGGISYWLSQGTNLESTSALVYATLGQGGASYSATQMQQFTGSTSNSMFASVIRCVERLSAWCKLNGLALEIPCVIHDQGENDYTYSASSYNSALVATQGAYETAINAVFTKFGLTNAGPVGTYAHVPFLCIQPSSWAFYSDTTAPAMYEFVKLAISTPSKFILIGPQYWNANYSTSSGQHMTGLGYRQCAEYTGRAIQRLRAGLASEAVYATAASNSGLTLTITFNTQSQLVHNTSVVSDPNGQWGMELAANGSNVAFSSPMIVGTNQVQFTLASSVTGMSCVLGIADYAYGTLGLTSGPTTSARAPLRDSSTDVMSAAAGGLTMYNYACHQQVSFTGA